MAGEVERERRVAGELADQVLVHVDPELRAELPLRVHEVGVACGAHHLGNALGEALGLIESADAKPDLAGLGGHRRGGIPRRNREIRVRKLRGVGLRVEVNREPVVLARERQADRAQRRNPLDLEGGLAAGRPVEEAPRVHVQAHERVRGQAGQVAVEGALGEAIVATALLESGNGLLFRAADDEDAAVLRQLAAALVRFVERRAVRGAVLAQVLGVRKKVGQLALVGHLHRGHDLGAAAERGLNGRGARDEVVAEQRLDVLVVVEPRLVDRALQGALELTGERELLDVRRKRLPLPVVQVGIDCEDHWSGLR